MAGGEKAGWELPFRHYVTFISPDRPGAHIALNFLEAINQPHKGVFQVYPKNWVGQSFWGRITEQVSEQSQSGFRQQIDGVESADKDLMNLPKRKVQPRGAGFAKMDEVVEGLGAIDNDAVEMG